MRLSILVALAKNRVIGRAGELPWRLPDELKNLKKITMGHTLIMGRKTWDSIDRRALPGRRNVILTRQPTHEVVPEGVSARAWLADYFFKQYSEEYKLDLASFCTHSEIMDSILYSLFPNLGSQHN